MSNISQEWKRYWGVWVNAQNGRNCMNYMKSLVLYGVAKGMENESDLSYAVGSRQSRINAILTALDYEKLVHQLEKNYRITEEGRVAIETVKEYHGYLLKPSKSLAERLMLLEFVNMKEIKEMLEYEEFSPRELLLSLRRMESDMLIGHQATPSGNVYFWLTDLGKKSKDAFHELLFV